MLAITVAVTLTQPTDRRPFSGSTGRYAVGFWNR
jgi:hypothetical protein